MAPNSRAWILITVAGVFLLHFAATQLPPAPGPLWPSTCNPTQQDRLSACVFIAGVPWNSTDVMLQACCSTWAALDCMLGIGKMCAPDWIQNYVGKQQSQALPACTAYPPGSKICADTAPAGMNLTQLLNPPRLNVNYNF